MKKYLIMIAIVIATISMSTFVSFASTEESHERESISFAEAKKIAKQLNTSTDSVLLMSSDERNILVDGNAKFDKSTDKDYQVFVTYIDSNNPTEHKYLSFELDEQNYKKYYNGKSKIEIVSFINSNNPQFGKRIQETTTERDTYLASAGSSVYYSEAIDAGVLETILESYTMNTSTHIKRHFAYTWQWKTSPYWFLKDGAGITHNGLNYTGLFGYGGYLDYLDTTWKRINITPEIVNPGISAIIDTKCSKQQIGRIWYIVGNVRSQINPNSLFTAYARYGHKQISGGVSVSFGSGGISFTPTFSGVIKASKQLVLGQLNGL